jgi:hypothetical protein
MVGSTNTRTGLPAWLETPLLEFAQLVCTMDVFLPVKADVRPISAATGLPLPALIGTWTLVTG